MDHEGTQLDHPVFATLRWREESSWWTTQHAHPSGRSIDVIIDPVDDDRVAFLDREAELFRWALDQEQRILKKAIRTDLLELFNDTWRRSDTAELTAAELSARLKWELLSISSSDDVPVEFSYNAGDLFGHHGVTIEVDEQLKYRDVDLRG